MLRGDLAESERLSEEALAIGSMSGQPEALGVYGGQLMEIRQQQDRLDEIIEPFAQVAADNPGIPVLEVCLGGLFCLMGRCDEGRRYIEAWSPDRFVASHSPFGAPEGGLGTRSGWRLVPGSADSDIRSCRDRLFSRFDNALRVCYTFASSSMRK